jgi:anti-sigma factor RsiW
MNEERRNVLKENLVRYQAPDVLVARLRAEAAQLEPAAVSPRGGWRPWAMRVAAGIVIAAASSALTLIATRAPRATPLESELVASHIRSLMPGHLTDVESSNQHNVKPWFNGRVDLSPTVPDLSSSGFPLLGGRLDYVSARAVPVIVYARHGHMINVYEWPASLSAHYEAQTVNGYHLVEWYRAGMEYWAISDLNVGELNGFVRAFVTATQ